MRRLLLLMLAGAPACADENAAADPLDRSVLEALATDQGSASGAAWSGTYEVEFTLDSCDCPSIEIDASMVDLCSVLSLDDQLIEFSQADGLLIVPVASAMFSGPIDADGTFALASIHDVSSELGESTVLGRVDGVLEIVDDQARAEGSFGQRLVADLGGDPIDCRSLGEFEALRTLP